jgi:hypothetical protein
MGRGEVLAYLPRPNPDRLTGAVRLNHSLQLQNLFLELSLREQDQARPGAGIIQVLRGLLPLDNEDLVRE